MTQPSDDMSGQTELIAAEIQALHKGRGIQAHDLDTRLGPRLRELAGDDPAAFRRVLTIQLNSCALQLPGDMTVAVTASLGLQGQTSEMPFFRERVDWLASSLGRDSRTALRRISAAERLLAEVIAGELNQRHRRAATAPNGWYLAELHALLRLDAPTPESQERRRIVATQAGLREVKAWLDIPGRPGQPAPGLSAEVLYGGRLVRRESPSGSRVEFFIQLPAPLQVGQEHEYGLVTRVSEGATMRSHYLVTPECRCDALDMRVRFSLDRRPEWVRRIDGETVRTFDIPQPVGDLIKPDAAGEVHQEFTDLTMFLGYGIQWQP
jgi:hypothetical protein